MSLWEKGVHVILAKKISHEFPLNEEKNAIPNHT